MRMPIAALSFLLLTVGLSVAHAHASLSHASPSAGSALSAAPREVTLTFTDTLEAAFSKLTVMDANGIDVSSGKTKVTGNMMRVGLKTLDVGVYRVNWSAVSADAHKTDGSFTFRVESQ